MTVPWITVDVDLWKHPKMAALPSDSARWGWLVTLSEAKLQKRPGTFASDRHFREVLGRFARFLADYEKVRLLDRAKDGALAVHDWPQHQWKVTKARQREEKEETESGQKEDASRAVSVPVLVSSTEEGVQGEKPDDEPEFVLLQWLSKHGCYVTPGNGYHRQLITAVERAGAPAMLRMFEKLARAGIEDGDTRGFVFGAINALKPKPDMKAVEAEDTLAAERERSARRQAATKKLVEEYEGYTHD